MTSTLARSFFGAALVFGVMSSSTAGEPETHPVRTTPSSLDQISPTTSAACPSASSLLKDGICPVDVMANMPGSIGNLAGLFARLPFRNFMPPTIMGRIIAGQILQAQEPETPGLGKTNSYENVPGVPVTSVTMPPRNRPPQI